MFVPVNATDTPTPTVTGSPSTPETTSTSTGTLAPVGGTVGNLDLGTLALWLAAAILVSGVIVMLIRLVMAKATDGKEEPEDKSVVRGWLAVLLVSGLLLFGAMSFYMTDAALRNLVIGGIVASAGTVTAFYFASKSSEQTQKQLLDAAFGNAGVVLPDVKGLSVAQAQGLLNSLQVKVLTPVGVAVTTSVTDSSPKAGSRVRINEEVTLIT
jgi:hypothetical protein